MIIKGNTVGHPLADPRNGLSMKGAVNMNGQKLTKLAEPVDDDDAATKKYAKDYADSLRELFTVVVPSAGWSESAPFTQTIQIEGILETDRPHYGVVYSADIDTALAEKEAFSLVDDLDTEEGSVTFTCFEEKPETDLTVQLEVNR